MAAPRKEPADVQPAAAPTALEQQLEAERGGAQNDEHRAAAGKRAAAAAGAGNPQYLDALLAERRGYVVRRLPERVAAVDAEIERRGGTVPADDESGR